MTASVTGVKTIVAEFNKLITADPTDIKVSVKKGNSVKDCTATVDGSNLVIAMDTKLMAGTYTVSVEGVDTAAMTADVVVEKDETLTTFEISPNLAMAGKEATDSAICYYAALNQYGEMMVADRPEVTSSFSSDTSIIKTASATEKGKIKVEKIPSVLAIQGTTGTMVLVDKNNGVNTTATVTISEFASAAEVTIAGTYNTITSSIEPLRNGADLSNYYILLTAKDQYGEEVDRDDFADIANISIAGGITNISIYDPADMDNSLTSVVVEGKEYIAIKLTGAYRDNIAETGTYTMTIVNEKKGLLSSATYDVIDDVVVKSISITPKIGIYENEENEMEYSIIDTEGNEVTSYAILSNVMSFSSTVGTMRWEKNSDGTGKLVFDARDLNLSAQNSYTATTIGTVVVYANNNTSADYIVKTFTFTVGREREIMAAYGLASDAITSVAVGETLKINLNKLVYVDQYSNKVTKDDEDIYNGYVTAGAIAGNAIGCSVYFKSKDGAFSVTNGGIARIAGDKFEFESTKAGSMDVYLKYGSEFREDYAASERASDENYDVKFTVTAVNTDSVATTSLKIASVYDGYVVRANASGAAATLSKDAIKVVGIIGGSETRIPTSQYVIKSITNDKFTQAEMDAGTKTKTATVTIQVTTWDAYNNATETELSADYEVSYATEKAYKIISVSGGAMSTSSAGAVTASALQDLFTFEDQYNTYGSVGTSAAVVLSNSSIKIATNVTYDVTVLNDSSKAVKVTGNGTNDVKITFDGAKLGFDDSGNDYFNLKVKATLNGVTKEVTVPVIVTR